MKDNVISENLYKYIKSQINGFEILSKSNSLLMKILGVLLFFNKGFNKRFITTVGSKVYVPDELMGKYYLWKIICHEFVHMAHSKHSPVWFSIKYLFPLWLSLLSLLSFCGGWWLLNLVWLVALSPLPAYFRMKEELAGYTMTMYVDWLLYKRIPQENIDYIAANFYKSNYYWMWPFKEDVLQRLTREKFRIMDGQYDNIYPFDHVRRIVLEGQGKAT